MRMGLFARELVDRDDAGSLLWGNLSETHLPGDIGPTGAPRRVFGQ